MLDTLVDQESYLKQLLDDFPDGVFTIDTELQIKYANPAFCRMIGLPAERLVGTCITQYLGDMNILDACMASVADTGKCLHQETIFKTIDGQEVHISKNVQALYDERGAIRDILVSVRDMSELHELNKQLEASKLQVEHYAENLESLVAERTRSLNEKMAFLAEYQKAVDCSSIVSKCSLDRSITYVNDALCERLGYSREELQGQPFTGTWAPQVSNMANAMWSCTEDGSVWREIVPQLTKSRSTCYLDTTVVPIRDHVGTITEYVAIGYDVSELVDKTEKLTARLFTDPLTLLPNRVKLLTDLNEIHSCLTLILLNIDGFKEINTFFGHQVGDVILRDLATELKKLSATVPMAHVYKLPVDEYAVLLKGVRTRAAVEEHVQAFSEAISCKAFTPGADAISLNVTIGIASCGTEAPSDGSQRELLSQSDMALKLAKKLRKPYLFYDTSMHIKEEYENNLIWIRRLRSAIDDGRVINYYQPIFNSRTLAVEKYECLMRILDEDGRVIAPGEFLEVAKRVKLYHQLTRLVLDQALHRFADQPYRFSINLSIEDIVDGFMSAYILERVHNCPFADRIIFEILESEGIENYDIVNDFIKEVKRYGARIAIDDFGAGYSNFAYIMRLDIDYIKVDGSIIHDIDHNPSSQVITETIVDFAAKLGIGTIAEYVWNDKVFAHVKSLGVDGLQGDHLGTPTPHLRNE
jgi:diguanylate cyclase (GGDEF)-like protein/PAS domain S-box-containing protein